MSMGKFKTRELTPEELERIENNFTYHPPQGDQVEKYSVIRSMFRQTAAFLCRTCPQSRELSIALTHLEDAMMWANAAIARNEKIE